MGGNTRRSCALALSALAVSMLTACSATTAGTGTALGRTAPAPTSASPTPSAAAQSSLITLPRLHIRARLAAAPHQSTLRRTVYAHTAEAHTIDVHTAVLGLDPITEITEEDIAPAFPSSAAQTILSSAVAAFAATSGMDVDFQDSAVFQHHTARTVTLTGKAGTDYQLLLFMTSGSRLYLVLAQRGTAYDALTRSIQLLP